MQVPRTAARELDVLSPTTEEVDWAQRRCRSEDHHLALELMLKCFQRLGYFPKAEEVPPVVVDHIRHCLGFPDYVTPISAERTAATHRDLVREKLGVVFDPERARAIAADAIRDAAAIKNNPPDLINIALEMLVKASLELPAYSTLSHMASRIRSEVNAAIFDRIVSRISLPDRVELDALLEVTGPRGKSQFNRFKQAAGRASWTAFRQQVLYLEWVDSIGDTSLWLEGIAETKIADFSMEAAVADAAVMGDVAPLKRTALLACRVHTARMQARDDLTEMFCKRIASITKRARTELEELRTRQLEMSEKLITNYREVLLHLDPRAEGVATSAALELARATVANAGGFEAQLADIEAVVAHHANNYVPLVARHWRKDRSTMFAFVRTVELEATSADHSVLDAVEHALAHSHFTRDFIPGHVEGTLLDLSFASEQWQRIVRVKDHPDQVNRRHFEACVFTYLAEELRTGDIAVKGSQAYANWSGQLLSWEECEPLLDEFCSEVGLPNSARAFTEGLSTMLSNRAAEVDAGYPTPTW